MARKSNGKIGITKKIIKQDSLIKELEVLESEKKLYEKKIIFTTINDLRLVYHTNSEKFIANLKEIHFNFVIYYEFAKGEEPTIDGERIVKVSLPKSKK